MSSSAIVPVSQGAGTSTSLGFIRLDNFRDAMEFAGVIAKSDLVPAAYRGKPADIMIAMQMGAELGLSYLQALQSIGVINGRPGIFGDALLALIIGQPDCEDVIEVEPEGDDPTKWVAVSTVKRKGKSPVTRRFSYDDAKKAGLWGKSGPWTNYPKRMLLWRARGFSVRDSFPDRLRGIITFEEAADIPAEATYAEPKRIGASSTVAEAAPAAVAPAEAPAEALAVASAPPAPKAISGDLSMSHLLVLDTKVGKDTKGAIYHVTTNDGPFLTRDEGLYRALAEIEGTDHECAVTYRQAKDGKGGTVRALVSVEVADTTPEPEPAA